MTTINRPQDCLHCSCRHIEGVHDATLFGQTIHVLADHATTPAKMLEALALNVPDVQWRPITPSLEDVFVTLSRSAERGDLSESLMTETMPPSAETSPPETDHAEKVFSGSAISKASRGAGLFSGFAAIFQKEFSHIRRDPATLFFALIVPVLQTIVLRGADFFDLLPSVAGLSVSTIVVLAFSLMRFRKQLA
ncbi:MAG: hypothetical protein WKF77_29540 [Planctomycetaceae bacterium]